MSAPETAPETAPDTPPFDAPWQAQAFALAVAAADAGLFTWADWTARFARRRAVGSAADDGSDYYDHWLATLEQMLSAAAPSAEVNQLAAAWQRAAEATPHGTPIDLANDPHTRADRAQT